MRNDNDTKTSLILSACGIIPVVWLALLTAPYVGGGIVEIISNLSVAINNPFSITVCEDSAKTVPVSYTHLDVYKRQLFGRGIDYSLIQECVADGTIYESADYHNAVFVGKDKDGTPRYAACRGTMGSFRLDASGSDKRYSFRLLAKEPTATVHLFEAAIDLLSYATYLKCEGKDYKSENLLSLSGVYQPKKEIKDSKIPIALTTFLKDNPHIKTIVLHLDNDKAVSYTHLDVYKRQRSTPMCNENKTTARKEETHAEATDGQR